MTEAFRYNQILFGSLTGILLRAGSAKGNSILDGYLVIESNGETDIRPLMETVAGTRKRTRIIPHDGGSRYVAGGVDGNN